MAPADLAPFEPIDGLDGRRAPATQHDAWLWISGAEPDVTWQSARAATLAVADAADLAAEQQAFTYLGGRDITGFIDGTANPPGPPRGRRRARPPRASRRRRKPRAGMRWVHDLVAFNRLSVEDQQRVFGRTKADSVELSGAEKPPNAHIARVEMTVDGEELEIFRRSVPYGTAAEHGLFFVAFSAERSRLERRLDLLGVDVLAAADDHVLDAVDDPQVAVRVEDADVAGVQPPVDDRLRRSPRAG